MFWCASIPWISFVVTRFGGQPRWMGAVCVFLLALILSEWPALVAAVVVAAAAPRSAWRFAAFPVAWMASEHARAYVYKGFPWNLTANALALHPVWIQTASWWGAFGVGALVAAFAALAAGIAVAASARARAAAALALLGEVALVGAFGTWRLRQPPRSPFAPVRVACLQPNIPQSVRLSSEGAARQYETVLSYLLDAAEKRPDLILVPESSFYGVTWQDSATLRRDLLSISARSGAAILFNDVDEESDTVYYNAARLVTPAGLAGGTYRKVHLVPFGEYVPLPRVFFFMKSISQAVGAFTAAKEPVVLTAGWLTLGPAVCYEMTYPSLSRKQTLDGATMLATISNDAWYGKAGAQEQHFEAMVLRAVENERPFARAAITGISGIVDSRGRQLARIPADRAGIAEAAVAPEGAVTVWTRWGGVVFPAAADVSALCMVIWGFVRWRRRK